MSHLKNFTGEKLDMEKSVNNFHKPSAQTYKNINESYPIPPSSRLLSDKLKKGKILRYKKDFFCVTLILLATAMQFVAYWYQWPWYTIFIFLFMLRTVNLAEHNHSHVSIFRNYFLNEAIGWCMFLYGGIPFEVYKEQHVRVHHQSLGTPLDWTSPYNYHGAHFPDKPVNRIYYYLTYPILSILECLIVFLRDPKAIKSINFVFSLVIVGAAMIALIRHNPFNFFYFYLIPWFLAYTYLAHANWVYHVGCEYDSAYTVAKTDNSFLGRTLGFNVGYHAAHHWHPTLHWSLIKEFHDIYVAPHTPPRYYV